MVGPTRWAERGKEKAELADTAAWGWLKAEEVEGRGCGVWFPCLASRNRYAGGSSAPPTPPTPYVIAPRRPKPLFLRELNFCTLTHLRGLVATSCASPFLQFRPRNSCFAEETEVSLELLQIIQVNCGMDIHQKLVQRGKKH